METGESRNQIENERQDTKERIELIAASAHVHFKDTALNIDKPWGENDVAQVKGFLFESAPLAHPKLFPNYWEHLIAASIYAKKFAEIINEPALNVHEAETILLLHDIGRLAIPYRYLRNDIVADAILKRIGVRKDFLDKFPSVPKILDVKVPFISTGGFRKLEDVPETKRVLDISDNFGKRDHGGTLLTVDAFINFVKGQPQRYANTIWPSERAGIEALNSGKQEFAVVLLLDEVKWFENKYGVTLSQIREEVAQELESPDNQEFLLALKNSRETLSVAVDEKLGRPGIKTIVFDIGNVLLGGPVGQDIDKALSEKIAKEFGCSTEKAYAAFLELSTDDIMTGKAGEEQYLRQFWQSLGKEPPVDIEDARRPFIQPEVYTPIEGMQKIVASLSKNPKINIFCLSDVIASLTPAVFSAMAKHFPQIPADRIIVSNKIGAAKREKGGAAFKTTLSRIGTEDAQTVLFVDDKEPYTTVFRAQFSGRGFTFRGNTYVSLKSAERLNVELQKAGLLH